MVLVWVVSAKHRGEKEEIQPMVFGPRSNSPPRHSFFLALLCSDFDIWTLSDNGDLDALIGISKKVVGVKKDLWLLFGVPRLSSTLYCHLNWPRHGKAERDKKSFGKNRNPFFDHISTIWYGIRTHSQIMVVGQREREAIKSPLLSESPFLSRKNGSGIH